MTIRIAIAGMSTESSTFAPHRTGLDDFWIKRGDELAERYPYLANWPSVEFLPLLQASAMPGGQVLPEVYDQIEAEILSLVSKALEGGPLDGFHFDIHGAMCVDGRLDAEAVLVSKIRELVGPDCLISASLDLHGQVSHALISHCDLLTAYRTAPHIDYLETRERAMRNLVHCLEYEIRPLRAWVRVPVLLPGEKTSTRVEPAASIYQSLETSEALPEVIDASLLVGYAWADEPRSAATVIVSGVDADVVAAEASRLAKAWWEARDGFEFCAPSGQADWAISQALNAPDSERPFFISDSGDNPTAGGSNDQGYLLGEFLAHPQLASGERKAIWASCIAPQAVASCVAAGVGATVTVSVGGLYGGSAPVTMTGEVTALSTSPRTGGAIAVVRSGGVSAVLTEKRAAYHYVKDLLELGLDPNEHDITAIKIGYLQPDLFAHAKGWVMALTPGGVDQHLERLTYNQVVRPVHPLDANLADPDLTPELFRS